jgi:hypothetical protein
MDYFDMIGYWLEEADRGLLLLINGHHAPMLDSLMWMVSGRLTWLPLYLLLAFRLFRREGLRRGLIAAVMIAVMIVTVDQLCASVIRPLVCRLRPSNPDNPVSALVTVVNGYRGGRYGFPSCHAANTFALATFLSLVFRNRRITLCLMAWSLLVGLSRVYLGVHYPADILGGCVIGALIAAVCYRAFRPDNLLTAS